MPEPTASQAPPTSTATPEGIVIPPVPDAAEPSPEGIVIPPVPDASPSSPSAE